uniref:Reverse transcriptase domain-containing protein n=1 Tax=Tanacetum cinerariifolium TaxID=118510 RepID=A0A6L2MR34_TANCI|nr:reverse transcriptase domain-containing protein [Tanacetum cinerariifolium]
MIRVSLREPIRVRGCATWDLDRVTWGGRDKGEEENRNVWKLNEATRKDHFPLPFMDQMLERLARNEYYCFLDGFSGYFQIPIDPKDQEKTTFTCPYGTFAYRHMPFGLCNAPETFKRCMMAIFHDMIEKTMEVMATPAIPVFGEENLGDLIDIRMEIIHPEPIAAVAFPATAIELTALRFRVDIAEAENASLRARIKTIEAIEKITHKRERQARVEIEQQLAAVQESQRQDQENFKKPKELMTSQFGQHS